jgi:four helix bundle protein
MENSGKSNFNPKFRIRTKQFAIKLCKLFNLPQKGESTRILVKQIIRSGTSVAANFYAATRARSVAEYYAKLCIVVEECDETLFWVDLLNEAELLQSKELLLLHKEAKELLKVFATAKKNLKSRMNTTK